MSDLKLRAAVSQFREDITLRDMLTPLFRRKQLIVVTFALLILVSVLAAVGASHKYESNMEILVNRERSDPLVTHGSYQPSGNSAVRRHRRGN